MQLQPMIGLRHVALIVEHFDACLAFYTEVMGMTIEWQPDADNAYLTTGHDSLALHRGVVATQERIRLDHIGFALASFDQVDVWFEHCKALQVKIVAAPKTHRDGARSFYCQDPDGNTIQMIYHQPLSLG